MQARDFILVLVGEELCVVPGYRLGELGAAGFLVFRVPGSLDERAVSPCIGAVLVLREELDAPVDELVDVAREMLIDGNDVGGPRDALHSLDIDGRAPAPLEALLVEIDSDPVQLDRALERACR